MVNSALLIILLVILPIILAQNMHQLFYPDGEGGLMGVENKMKSPMNLTDIEVTSRYETFIDEIIANGTATLTLAINKALIQQTEDANVVFAPVSIAAALALILLGSNGRTFQELTTVLGLTTGVDIEANSLLVHEQFGRMINKLERTSGFDMGEQVSFAAGIFVQKDYPVREVYVKTAQDLYASEVYNLDFQRDSASAQQFINNWVSQRTNGKIKDILGEEPQPDTKVIIASAMYFKALWEKPFFEGTTTKRPFYTYGRKSPTNIEVEMMANGGSFPYFKDHTLNCEILGLPYKGNSSVMYVVMPANSNNKVLQDFEQALTAADLRRLADSTVYTRAVLLFPKMRLESTTDLKSSLEKLGVKSLFVPSQANLALLSPGDSSNGTPVSAGVLQEPPNPSLNTKVNSPVVFPNRFSDTNDVNKVGNNDSSITTLYTSPINPATPKYQNTIVQTTNRFQGVPEKIITSRAVETIDNLRRIINQQSVDNNYQNPGLYADKVIHKVFMDITETGTEAAASTSVSLSRDGGRVTFRVDVPFFFFIRNEETKTILFWGSVSTPTPNFKRSV